MVFPVPRQFPHGRATVVEGGFRVTGRWPFGSGCQNSDWLGFTVGVYLGDQPRLDEAGLPEQRVLIAPASSAIIHDTWHVSGLRGTGSTDVELRDVFVPDAWSFWWTETQPHPGALYRHRWWLLAHGAQRLGVARAMIETVYDLAQVKTPVRGTNLIRDRSITQMQFAQAEAICSSARAFLWETTRTLWEKTSAGARAGRKSHVIVIRRRRL